MNYTSNSLPEAYIAVGKNKNRLKIYNGKDVFLKDGEEFQIELFNPTTKTFGAKILVNGVPISNSLLVIKPGERSYLERYLDDNKKFLFDTYVVENSKQVKDAIRNNGNVRIEFYSEKIPNVVITTTPTYIYNYPLYYVNPTITLGPSYTTIGGTGGYYGLTGGLSGTTGVSGLTGTTDGTLTCSNISTTTCDSTFFVNNANIANTASFNTASFNVSAEASSTPIETGRVEKGSNSDQSFTNYYGDFETFYFTAKEYKLLPESTKPKEMKDIRQYCPGCRTRIKKSSWKFCPSCGESLD